jgi:hypothetical protein
LTKKSRQGNKGVVHTIDLLNNQYNGQPLESRPNLMEVDEFMTNNDIREPINEVVQHITRNIFGRLLKPVEFPENNADRTRYDQLIREMGRTLPPS